MHTQQEQPGGWESAREGVLHVTISMVTAWARTPDIIKTGIRAEENWFQPHTGKINEK